MKNITFSADANLIERARAGARSRGTTLNVEFRRWLEQSAGPTEEERRRTVEEYRALMKRLSYVDLGGRKFTREEMNERHPKWHE